MKTFYKVLTITVFTFMFVFAAQAKTAQITDFGAIPDDNEDDTQAVRAAVADLIENGGGTLVFPSGVTDISDEIQIIGHQLVSFRLSGDKGSFIKLNGNETTNYFVFERSIQVEINDLNFIGNHDALLNADRVIWAKDAGQTKIGNCAFFDIGAVTAIVEFNATTAMIEDTVFSGSAAQLSAVYLHNGKGLVMRNVSFNNEGEYLNYMACKSADIHPKHWVKVENRIETGKSAIRVKDSFFDSAAWKSIRVENQNALSLDGVTVKVSPDKTGAGVSVSNVGYTEALNSMFSSSARPRRAFEVRDNSHLEVNSVTLTDEVKFGDFDSSASYQIRYCPTCGVSNANRLKK